MKFSLWSMVVTAILIPFASSVDAQYYYSKGRKAELKVDSSKVVIKCSDGIQVDAVASRIGRIAKVLDEPDMLPGFVACSLSVRNGYNAFVDSLNRTGGIYLAEPYYLFPSGMVSPVGETFIVAFDPSVSRSQVDSISGALGIKVDCELVPLKNVFVLRNTDSSGHRLLDIVNVLHDLKGVLYSHPQFGVRGKLCAYRLFDHYHSFQPHIKKVIGSFNSASVWDFAGLTHPVSVAVLDDGMISHEDLPDSRIQRGQDFTGLGYVQPENYYGHGLACAGIIAASHTTDSATGMQSSSGIISLNPHATIRPARVAIHDTLTLIEHIAQAVTWAGDMGAEILNCSWSEGVGFASNETFELALNTVVETGRNGRGCLVICAAGNDGAKFPGIGYPARLPMCLGVGSTRLDDTRWWYSNCDTTLDLVAPSSDGYSDGGFWTLDQMGILGYNPTFFSDCPSSGGDDMNYCCHFSGTSASTPIVSGVASLILSKDSMLTVYQVYDILRNSAVHLGSPVPNDQFGYGRVDAFRAVLSISHGDASNDNIIDISDVFAIVDYLWGGPALFPSVLLGDCDCSGTVDITDIDYLLNYLSCTGPPPVKPCFAF